MSDIKELFNRAWELGFWYCVDEYVGVPADPADLRSVTRRRDVENVHNAYVNEALLCKPFNIELTEKEEEVLRKRLGLPRPDPLLQALANAPLDDHEETPSERTAVETGRKELEEGSAVNHPKHYNMGKFEVIDVIEDWGLDFCLGNTVKYIARAKHKGSELEDLKKSQWYLQRALEQLEKAIEERSASSVIPLDRTHEYLEHELAGLSSYYDVSDDQQLSYVQKQSKLLSQLEEENRRQYRPSLGGVFRKNKFHPLFEMDEIELAEEHIEPPNPNKYSADQRAVVMYRILVNDAEMVRKVADIIIPRLFGTERSVDEWLKEEWYGIDGTFKTELVKRLRFLPIQLADQTRWNMGLESQQIQYLIVQAFSLKENQEIGREMESLVLSTKDEAVAALERLEARLAESNLSVDDSDPLRVLCNKWDELHQDQRSLLRRQALNVWGESFQ